MENTDPPVNDHVPVTDPYPTMPTPDDQTNHSFAQHLCPVHRKLLNLWLSGEWKCPGCGGPTPDEAAELRARYAGSRTTG